MKHYDNFDNTFFIKIICVIAALALIFVIVIAAVGLLTKDGSPISEGGEEETFIFGNTDTAELPQDDTEAPGTAPKETVSTDTEALDTENVPESEADSETITDTDTETENPEEEPPAPPSTILGETEDMGEEYINSMIFLGDSTTYGLKAYKMLKDGNKTKQVWTSTSATLSLSDILNKKIVYPETEKEMTIPEAARLAKPEYLIITLGVEGVTFLSEADFKAQYTSLVEAVLIASPETKIILQSIYPVAPSFTEKDKLNNPLIDKANGWVREIAEQTGVRYLDTQTVLKDEDGALDKKYDNGGNGINLNDSGFTAVLNYIRTHGYK